MGVMELPTEGTITTTEVAWLLGYDGPHARKVANNWLRRNNVPVLFRYPGKHGENVYYRAAVRDAQKKTPGRGCRTDLGKQKVQKAGECMRASKLAQVLEELIRDNADAIVIDQLGYPVKDLSCRVYEGKNPTIVLYFEDRPVVESG
jgi:hypothetical protein